jgi:hypothetical protein
MTGTNRGANIAAAEMEKSRRALATAGPMLGPVTSTLPSTALITPQ